MRPETCVDECKRKESAKEQMVAARLRLAVQSWRDTGRPADWSLAIARYLIARGWA